MFLLRYGSTLIEMVREAVVRANPYAISFIKNPSPVVQALAVSSNPLTIACIENPTDDVFRIMLRECPWLVKDVAKSKTQRLMAIESDPHNLRHFPDDKYLYTLAFRLDKTTIQYIADPSPDMQYTAVTSDPLNIRFLNAETRPHYLNWMAVERNGMALQYVPESQQSESLCERAVRYEGAALEFAHYQTQDCIKYAVRASAASVKFSNDASWNDEAIAQNPWMLLRVSNTTDYIRSEAIREVPDLILELNERDVTQNDYFNALTSEGGIYSRLDDPSLVEENTILRVIQDDPAFLQHIDDQNEDHHFAVLKAASTNTIALRFLKNPSKEIMMELSKINTDAAYFLDKPCNFSLLACFSGRSNLKPSYRLSLYKSYVSSDAVIDFAHRHRGPFNQMLSWYDHPSW